MASTTLKLSELREGRDFEAGKTHPLTILTTTRVRLTGMFFDLNKCFLLPSAMHGIKAIKRQYDEHPDSELLIVGHTDTSGKDAYNETLSLERAEAVAAYLHNDVEAWLKFFDPQKPKEKLWGNLEIQHMLTKLPERKKPHFIGKPNGILNSAHIKAVKSFQADNDLEVDGIAGPLTRKALVTAYMNLDDTSLPEGIKLTTHGCGENFPDKDTGNGVRKLENRRVELFFFDQEIDPKPAGTISKKGSKEYPKWLEGVSKTLDVNLGTGEETGDIIESTLPVDQLKGLADKRGEDFFALWMGVQFGTDIPDEKYRRLHKDLLQDQLLMPPIVVVPDDVLDDHLGAFNKSAKRIEVAESLVIKVAEEKDNVSAWLILLILVEEFGHFLDDHLRDGVGDADGDEGARFGHSLLNLEWNRNTEFEYGKLTRAVSQEEFPLKVDWKEAKELVDKLMGEREQANDEQTDDREFFGAGRLNHSLDPHSWGHQAIEEAVVKKRRGEATLAKEIYFGNWLRDFSQVLTPLTLQWASPQALTQMIHVLAHSEFGLKSKFDVTQAKLGQYQFQEHIDHPFGNPGTQPSWSEFDMPTLTPKYLGNGSTSVNFPNAGQYIREQLALAKSKGNTDEGRRHLGQGLHTLEDYYAHSNFCELVLINLGNTKVSPWTTGRINGIAPIVTGSFTTVDTAASIILGIAEKVGKAKECKVFEEDPSFMMKAAFILVGEIIKGADSLSKKRADLQRLWDNWADQTMELIHFAMERGLLSDHPLAKFGQKTVLKVYAYVHCQITTHIAKFTSAIIAAIADALFEKILEHEVHFDGTLGSAIHDLGTELGHAQLAVTGSGVYPSHTQLAKDHDDHPLHDLAAQMAIHSVGATFDAMIANWNGVAGAPDPGAVATSFLVHPFRLTSGTPTGTLIDIASDWAKANSAKVKQAATPTWIEHHREELRNARKLAKKIAADSMGEKFVEEFFVLVKAILKEGPN
jgi:outer membrane protein OmpA-like peptidoglycan-associated protein